jgi:hypothetical protein
MRRHVRWFTFTVAAMAFLFTQNFGQAQTIRLLSPNSAQAGAVAYQNTSLKLVVFGQGFSQKHQVFWNGSALPTTYVSSSKLTTSLQAGALYTPGKAQVAVGDSSGMSDPAVFTITTDPVPVLTSMNPSMMLAGGDTFRLNVVGMNLPRLAVIQWNLSDRPTDYFSNVTVDAAISAADIAYPGTVDICLIDGGFSDAVSNTISLQVFVNTPPPVIEKLEPSRVEAGSGPFGLLVRGNYFTPTSIVRWNGANRDTTFVDRNTLVAVIPDTDIAIPALVDISVMETAPGGSLSNASKFLVGATPTLIFPQYLVGNGYSTTLTILNLGNTEVTGNLTLIDKSGEPYPGFPTSNGTSPQAAAVVPIQIPPGSVRVFRLQGPQSDSAIAAGWAKVESGPGTLLGYTNIQVRRAGVLSNSSIVPNGDPMPAMEIPIDNDDSAGRYTGFTVTNFDATGMNLKVAIYDQEGHLVEVVTPPDLNPLPPGRQAAKFIHEVAPSTRGKFKGSMVLYTVDGKKFPALGLVQSEALLSIMPAATPLYFTAP